MQPQWQYWCTLNGLIHPFRRQEKISVSMTYRSWSRMVMEDAWWRRWWWRRRPQRGLGPARLALLLLLLLLRLHLRLRQGGPHHDARLLLLPALLVVLGDGGGRSGARVLVLVVGAVHEVRRGAGRAASASAATAACR